MGINSPYGKELTGAEAERIGNFRVRLASAGNTDFQQDSRRSLPGVPRKTVRTRTLREAASLCRAYISEYELGAGNWIGGDVTENGVLVARISYNGRIWDIPND